MTADICSRVSAHRITSDTSLQAMLAYFSAQNCLAEPDVQLFVQHKVLCELRNRLAGDLRPDLINQLIANQSTFHCLTVYHEVLLKTVLYVVPTREPVQLSKLLTESLLQDLINSFIASSSCPEHCFCSTIKCHFKLLLRFINEPNLIVKLTHPSIFAHFFNQIQSNSRCIAFEFLQLAIETLKRNQTNDQLIKYFNELISKSTLLNILLPFFSIPRCFAGPREPNESDNDLENIYDCVLIRSYILLSARLLLVISSDLKRNFLHQLYLIKPDDKDDLSSWLVEIFITEDSELFQFFHLSALLAKTLAEIQFVDCLFLAFLTSIYHDTSTLIEMLTTDTGTATSTLQFLLAYLKLPRDQEPLDAAIAKTLKRLKHKISRLYSKGLFPYNPSALLRLLNSV